MLKEILIVDDKIDIQEILADFLRNNGYKVEACANSKQASKRIREKKFDLIVTDLIMPEQDGFSFIAQTREEFDTPIIVMTGGSNAFDFKMGLRDLHERGYPILKKPFSREQFLHAVSTAIGPSIAA